MACPRSFDEDALLSGIMHVFRRQGFAATSVRDLESASGLTSGSLYNTYGDKQGLFDAASAHYMRKVLRRRIDEHAPPGSGLSGLKALFLSLLREPDGGSDGCLITNSAVEFGSASRPGFVSEGFTLLLTTFAERLAEERSPLARNTEPTTLLALYQGVLVLVRGGLDLADLEKTISQFFKKLEVHHDT